MNIRQNHYLFDSIIKYHTYTTYFFEKYLPMNNTFLFTNFFMSMKLKSDSVYWRYGNRVF